MVQPAVFDRQSQVKIGILRFLVKIQPVFQIALATNLETSARKGMKEVFQVVFQAANLIAVVQIEIQSLAL